MPIVTILKAALDYWYYIVIALLITIIGVQKISIQDHVLEETKLNNQVQIFTNTITENNKTIEVLSKRTESLLVELDKAKVTLDTTRKETGAKINEVMSRVIPKDCSEAIKNVTNALTKDIEEWNTGN